MAERGSDGLFTGCAGTAAGRVAAASEAAPAPPPASFNDTTAASARPVAGVAALAASSGHAAQMMAIRLAEAAGAGEARDGEHAEEAAEDGDAQGEGVPRLAP